MRVLGREFPLASQEDCDLGLESVGNFLRDLSEEFGAARGVDDTSVERHEREARPARGSTQDALVVRAETHVSAQRELAPPQVKQNFGPDESGLVPINFVSGHL